MRRVPVAFFSMVMGTAGLSMVWRQAATAWGAPTWIGTMIWLAAVALWLVVCGSYLITAWRHPAHAVGELLHHGSGVFAALAFMSLILLTVPLYSYAPTLAQWLWGIASLGQFLLGAWLVNRWVREPVDPALISGGWLLPPTGGNLVSAIAAAAFGHTDLAWMFLGAGTIAWLFVNSLIFTRQVSHAERLTEAQAPTAFIQIAPPVLVINALLPGLTPEVNGLVLGLWGFSLLSLATVLMSFPRMLSTPFGPHWWAMTFPSAALALATLKIAEYGSEEVSDYLAPVLVALATLLIAAIAVRTAQSALRGRLLPAVAQTPGTQQAPTNSSPGG
ncbi:MAG: hypothetical protein ACOYEV_02535 [Candidatus Nanopelagicales bacterium]